ncbi:RNA polymerase sigma factor [Actinomadura kijaniata]|uniref:RNA polymerase sigma-70 factor (ECF subfamily) n=1 Tax=Actinomadura namibiensis TaxID=182080 RepID=A0A7W3LJG3_ACTNM|nr:RNA polymerase sigma factor [Actinomadura namibiensis]MBA8949200.1 RNA polymerase sigma-70 factor (ECF subfamily) [Actinomadura namibiensis]
MTAAYARPDEIDDGELIRRSGDDPERFAALFDRYARQIHHYAARRLGTQAADDIVAETFEIAFRRRATYDPARSMARPWLYGIASTLIARHRRAEERHYRALRRTGVDPLPEPMAETVVSRVAAEQDERRLAGALARLSAGDRDVLLLFAWGGLGYDEIAEALSVPAGTVASRLNRARRKLRTVLGDD